MSALALSSRTTITARTMPANTKSASWPALPSNQGIARPLLEMTKRSSGFHASSIRGNVCRTTARFIKVRRRSSGKFLMTSTYAAAMVFTTRFLESLAMPTMVPRIVAKKMPTRATWMVFRNP